MMVKIFVLNKNFDSTRQENILSYIESLAADMKNNCTLYHCNIRLIVTIVTLD